jgi:hypothetical protein
VKCPFSFGRKVDRSINEILLACRDAPPKDPAEAAQSFIYVLACEFLQREARPDRAKQVVSDFKEAARALTGAAASGATVEEQALLLRTYRERFEFPEPDHRKRRKARGPTDTQLRKEYEPLHLQLIPILRDRTEKDGEAIVQELRKLAPWATDHALRVAAESAPEVAACTLLGSRYFLGSNTVRNRISKAKKQA